MISAQAAKTQSTKSDERLVFVDFTGRRRRFIAWFGWAVALACCGYLAALGSAFIML